MRRSTRQLKLAAPGAMIVGPCRCAQLMQVLVRAAFFLWLSVVNLVALSAMWARLADVFGSAASKRLFGFLGAGATCGGAPVPHPRSACSEHLICSQPPASTMCSQLINQI